MKDIIKSLLLAIITLYLINIIGQNFDFYIPINLYTILLVGLFRLPGIIIILIFLIIWKIFF